MNYLLKFVCISILCKVFGNSLYTDHQKIEYIYSPYPRFQFNINNTLAASNRIIYNQQSEILLTSWGKGGLAIFDIKTQSLEYIFQSSNSIRGIAVTKDSEHIFFAHENKLTMFQYIRQEEERILIKQRSGEETNNVIFDIILNKEEDIAIVLESNQIINIYDIRIKQKQNSKIPLIASVQAKSYVLNKGLLTQSEKYLYIANDYSGVVIFDFKKLVLSNINNDLQVDIKFKYQIPADWQAVDLVFTFDETYLYAADCWSGILIIQTHNSDLSSQQWQPELKNKNYWPDNSSTTPYSLKITQDDKYLLVAQRQQGILILDISIKSSPVLFQKIQIKGHAFSICLTSKDNNIFYANGETIFQFEKTTPNLNKDFPNLQNDHISYMHNIGDYQYRWRCYISPKDDYFFGAFDKGGLFVYSLKNDPISNQEMNPLILRYVNHVKFQKLTTIDSILFIEKLDLLFVSVTQNKTKMFAFKISDVIKQNNTDIKPIFQLKYENPEVLSETIISNSNNTMIFISNDNSFLLINTTDINHIHLITKFQLPARIIGTCSNGLFSKNSDYLILSVRNYGFISFNIKNPQYPKIEDELETLGGEFISNLITESNFAYIGDGYKGFFILDLNKLPQFNIISRLQADGWVNHITSYELEKYLLLSHMDNGYISLISIVDKLKPKTLSKISHKGQTAMSSCATNNKKYLFITNSMGVNIIPLLSKVLVHTQILQVLGKESGNISYLPLDPTTHLKIGQAFLFQFLPLYPSDQLKISDVKYYNQEYQLKDLPYWINLHLSQSSVEITAVKDGLGLDVSQSSLNQIVIVYKTALSDQSFTYQDIGDQLSTDNTIGKQVFEYLKEIDLISSDNYASIKFEQQLSISFSDLQLGGLEKQNNFRERVRQTMLYSITKNPIMFYISPSLKFNEESGEIESLSNYISVQLSFEKGFGKFITISYNGITNSFSDEGSSMKLEGNAQSLNNVFRFQKIVYFTNNTGLNNLYVKFNLQDNVNFDIQKVYKLSVLSIAQNQDEKQNKQNLSENKIKIMRPKIPIQLNSNFKHLQDQFSKIYASSEVPVEQNISFEFQETTFISPEGLPLKYKVLYNSGDGEYQNTMSNQWLQQSSNSLKFYGIPPITLYGTDLYIKVIASDGYDEFQDKFVIHINNIPFSYMVNLLFKILSPIAAIFGLYSYRSFFFNAIFKQKNIYTTELCIINTYYCKKIALLGDENLKAILLFNSMKKRMNLTLRKRRSNRSKTKKKSIIVYGLSINSLREEDGKQKDIELNMIQQQNDNNNNNDDEQQSQNIICSPKLTNNISYQNHNSINNLNNNKNQISSYIANDFSHLNLQLKGNISCDKSQLDSTKLQRAHPYSELRKEQIIFLDRMNTIKKQKTGFNQIADQFTRPDGSIRFSKIIQFMIQEKLSFKLRNEEFTAKLLVKDLKDENSRLYKSLRAVIARQFLLYDERTELFFDYLKDESLNQYNFKQKDWYKHYTEVVSSSSIVNDQLDTICFPQVLIKKNMIKQSLIGLRLINLNDDMEKTIQKNQINLRLLYEVLVAEALGLLEYIPSSFSKSQGESIHLNFFQISSIEAFKPIKNPNCSFIRKLMNMTLANYGASQNMKLPNWIKFDQKSSCIILSGVPTSSDIEDLIIRIFDKENFIIREFPLRIVDEEKQIPVEYDYESAMISSRRGDLSVTSDQIGQQMNFQVRNSAFSEPLSPVQNSTYQISKPSLFSNNVNNTPLSNFRLQKADSQDRESLEESESEYKKSFTHDRESLDENQQEYKPADLKFQFSSMRQKVKEIITEDEEKTTEKQKSDEKYIFKKEQKHIKNSKSFAEELKRQSLSDSNQSQRRFKSPSSQIEEKSSNKFQSLGDDAQSKSLSVSTKVKTFQFNQELKKSREKEEYDIESSQKPISLPNQFQQSRSNYFDQHNQ